jgi:hypothetical protein
MFVDQTEEFVYEKEFFKQNLLEEAVVQLADERFEKLLIT